MRESRECRATRREIDEASQDQRLPDRAVHHVATCTACREFHDQRTTLRELVGSLEPVTAPADFDVRLRARLRAQGGGGVGWFTFPRFAFGTPALAIAAAVVVIVGIVALLNRASLISKPADQAIAGSLPARPDKTSQPTTTPALATNSSESGHVEGGKDKIAKTGSTQTVGTLPKQLRTLKPNVAGKQVTSNDFTVQPAQVVKQSEFEQDAADFSPSQPFEFSLQDRHGVKRKISLPPLSFGSQQLGQNGQRFQPASYTANRIW